MKIDRNKPVLVNGAGIAGLTTALALANNGHSVCVFDKKQEPEPVGAGIQLSPNAMRILDQLGVGDKLRAFATEPVSLQIRNGTNDHVLANLQLGNKIRRRHGNPYLVIHRADLHNILLSQCKNHNNAQVEFGSEIVEFAPHTLGITTTIKQGQTYNERTGSMLMAADGVWSNLRSKILGLPKAYYSGKTAWRTLLSMEQKGWEEWKSRVRVWFGPNSHVVTYPVRSGTYLNIVIIKNAPLANEDKKQTITSEELKAGFKGWNGAFLSLLNSELKWTGWPLYVSGQIEKMNVGPIVLAGDAAHASLPFAAQGAAMAIEDAAIFERMYSTHDTAGEIAQAYSKARIARVSNILKTAEKNGRIYHMGQPGAFFRDWTMKLTPNFMLSRRQDWIYQWHADQ